MQPQKPGHGLYYEVEKECLKGFKWLREDVIPSIDSEELQELSKDIVDCTESWLRRYIKFASGAMSDYELMRFYNDTLKMFDVGIDARERQKSLVDDELAEAKELHAQGLISDDEFDEILEVAELTKQALDEEKERIRDLKNFCIKAKDRKDIVTCIEKVATTTHHRGAMLPVMCGAILPEDIVNSVTGLKDYEYTRIEDVGYWLSNETSKVLECIKRFGEPR